MAGDLWRAKLEIGKETTAGTAVAGSRLVYARTPTLTRVRDPRIHEFATGTRDTVRQLTLGPTQVGGQLVVPVSGDELVELFLMGIKGGVTPTTPTGATAGRLWTFKPDPTLDSATLRWLDAANTWVAAGNLVNQLTFAGNVNGEHLVTADLFGQSMVTGSLTGGLSERVPTFFEGWQTRMYIDSFGGTPGFTPAPGVLINWSVTITNNLGRKYTADNTLNASSIPIGTLGIQATLMFEAATARALTEYAAWDAVTKRLLRLEFLSPAAEIEAGVNEIQSLVATSASSGTFTLSFRGQTTGAIAYNANAGAVQTALVALSTIGTGGVVATGGPLPGTPVVLTFGGNLAGYDQPLITADNTLLVGGTAVITQTTPGYFGGRFLTLDIPGGWTAVNLSGEDAMTRTYEFSMNYVYDPTSIAAGIQIRAQNNRATAW
jgi:hypothetical protein